MTDSKYNEYLPIEKFLGMNVDYENPNTILEILNKPLDTSTFRQPDFEEFLNLPVNADYEKQREENDEYAKQRADYVASDEYKQKLYDETVKFYDDLIAEAEKEISEYNVVKDDNSDR